MLDTVLGGINQGFIWAILALGVYISFRILNFADLTCEGAITFGASISATLIWLGVPAPLSILVAFCGGALAGIVTGVLHTKLKIPPILAGILTMISLFSVNIHVMSIASGSAGTANLSLLNFMKNTVFAQVNGILGLGKLYSSLILGALIVVAVVTALYWFFGTEYGSAVRATGSNENMCRAQGVNTDLTKIAGLAVSNGLIAVCGALLCQYQNFSDVNMGVGAIVIGLASIIIGETIFARAKNFYLKLLGIAVGSVVYRVVITVVIFYGVPSTDLKLMTAVIVAVALSLPLVKSVIAKSAKKREAKRHG